MNTVKEEVCDEITDHENESTSSMNDSEFNSSQRQRTYSSSRNLVVSQTRDNLNMAAVDKTLASKMCVICGI